MKNWLWRRWGELRQAANRWRARRSRAQFVFVNWLEGVLSYTPFMLVRTVADIRKNYERELVSTREDNAAERKRLDEIIGRFMHVSAFTVEGRTYRLVLEFSDELVRRGLTPGDTLMVEYLARRMGHELERQLRAINFAALPDENEYHELRRRSQGWR
jgi:hypothetical protein